MRLEVFIAVAIIMMFFWVKAPCGLVGLNPKEDHEERAVVFDASTNTVVTPPFEHWGCNLEFRLRYLCEVFVRVFLLSCVGKDHAMNPLHTRWSLTYVWKNSHYQN
jgi:hypothetical protein